MRHHKDKHPYKDLPEKLTVRNTPGFGDTNASFNEVNSVAEQNSRQDRHDNEVTNTRKILFRTSMNVQTCYVISLNEKK